MLVDFLFVAKRPPICAIPVRSVYCAGLSRIAVNEYVYTSFVFGFDERILDLLYKHLVVAFIL